MKLQLIALYRVISNVVAIAPDPRGATGDGDVALLVKHWTGRLST